MIELTTGQVEHLTIDNVPLRLEVTKLSMWDATFTVTGPGVRNPTQPRTMPVLALATWLELARKEGLCQSLNI